MSSKQPPRKKIKQESGSSRILRSQGSALESDIEGSTGTATPINPRPTRKVKTPKNMGDSRRRSSRKNRNAELRDNEQNIVGSAKTTPSRKQSSQVQVATPSSSRKYENSALDTEIHESTLQEDEQDEEEFLDEEDEEDKEEETDHHQDAYAASSRRTRFNDISLAAMANLLSSNQSSTLKSLLSSLRQPDPSIQLMALTELANLLSMSTEESLAGYIQVDSLVAELVNIMRGPNAFGEDNPEMMLLACRCLANLMEAMPTSTANIAYGGAVPVLCQKLLEIEFIDLAEQALSTLEKISRDYPSAVVREGGMAACLTYLDFFSTNVQRIAVTTAANCAKNVPSDCFAVVRDVIPTLQNVISGSDSKVVEAACLCLTRVLESFKGHAQQLEQLLSPELLPSMMAVVAPLDARATGIPEYIKTRFIHVFAVGAKASAKIAEQLLTNDAVGMLYQLLTGLGKPVDATEIKANSVVVLQALIHRPQEQVSGILALVSEILPGLPEKEFFAALNAKDRGSQDSRETQFRSNCPRQYEEFVTIVLPTLLDMYNSTINSSLRRISLLALLKICYNLDTAVLKRVVEEVPLAVFITGVLGASQLELVLSGIRLVHILLDRVPEIYARKLSVEGSVAEVEKIATEYGRIGLPQATSTDISPSTHGSQGISRTIAHISEAREIDILGSDEKHNDQDAEDDIEDDEDDDNDEDDDDYDEMDGGEEDYVETEEQLLLDDDSISQVTDSTTTVTTDGSSPNMTAQLIAKWAGSFLRNFQALDLHDDAQDAICRQLTNLAAELKTNEYRRAFVELASILTGRYEITSYHLKSTGVLSALVDALTGALRREKRCDFLESCGSTSALPVLVLKLQELLSRAEKFDVAITSSSEEKRSANILTKQIRLKLVAAEDTDVPRSFRNLMVSIHAIATFKALDDYLRPRMQASALTGAGRPSRTSTPVSTTSNSNGLLGRAPEGLQGALAQLAAAGTALPESIRERLANLGVDTSALLGNVLGDDDQVAKRSHIAPTTPQASEENSEPAVSVELSASGDKAIARNAQGQRIVTPRTGTPVQTPSRAEKDNSTITPSSTMSYAAAVSSSPKDWHIQFEIDGRILPHETTIFGAINTARVVGDASTHGRPASSVYEIIFRKVAGPSPLPQGSIQELSIHGGPPASVERESETALLLCLMDVLHSMSTNAHELLPPGSQSAQSKVPAAAFVNTKLTAKLNRQLEEPLIVASQCLPAWAQDLPRYYPFLYPFETRYLFLQSTSFGYSRSMARWQAAAKKEGDDGRSFLGRLQRQKVRISRPRMLESATRVMDLYGASPSVLEVEYFEEVGTGLGPTLEFYSTVSKEIAKRRFNLWRDGESQTSSEYVFAKAGLFPQPLPIVENEQNVEISKRVLLLFRTIGIFLARAMIDSRLVDISFNPLFFRILSQKDDVALSIETIYRIDQDLARSLMLVKRFSDAYAQLTSDTSLSKEEHTERARAIEFDHVHIEDLGLDFTYPGRPDLELVPDGGQLDVTIENVSDYLDKVIDLTLSSGVARQCAAFRDGFSQVFPFGALSAFTPVELTMIFGRVDEDWSSENLATSIKADHGFTMDSAAVRNLIEVLSGMNELDKRDFLQFITGSPKLPIGGFKSLTPLLTVVCKPHEAPLTADDYLPSVMTCVNYLKLPDYSSAEVLKTKLLTAMREGGGSFHLS